MGRADLYPLVFAIVLSVVLLLLLQGVIGVMRKAERLHVAMAEGNVARAVLHAADFLSILLMSAATVQSCVHGENITKDLLWGGAFGVGSTVIYGLASRLGMRALLQAKMVGELEKGNAAAGIAAAGHAISTGILMSKSIAGDDLSSLGLSAFFFVLGQVTLHLYVALFRVFTQYNDAEEIEGENVAAALSYAGLSVALSIIIGRALEGTFTGWASSLASYGTMLAYGLGLYVVRQIILQTIILRGGFAVRGGIIDVEIGRDRNVGVGALEGASYIGAALLLAKLG
jgi:uncharacterized membrane protein YjfL (UPF0719 family)